MPAGAAARRRRSSRPPRGSASVELTSRRNARSCSPASSANSAVSPPISRPRRDTSASTWIAPSCTWRDNRSRSSSDAASRAARSSSAWARRAVCAAIPTARPDRELDDDRGVAAEVVVDEALDHRAGDHHHHTGEHAGDRTRTGSPPRSSRWWPTTSSATTGCPAPTGRRRRTRWTASAPPPRRVRPAPTRAPAAEALQIGDRAGRAPADQHGEQQPSDRRVVEVAG